MMISPIEIPRGVSVFTESSEIMDFFRQKLKFGVTISQYCNFSFSENIADKFERNSIFIDPRIFDMKLLRTAVLSNAFNFEKIHFVLPQSRVLEFISESGIPESSIIPIPCDKDIFIYPKNLPKQNNKLSLVNQKLLTENIQKELSILSRMAGSSDYMKNLKLMLIIAARSELPVLFLGETGTGKSMAAGFIHELSKRRNKPFSVINMGGLENGLVDSLIFGCVEGSYTDAKNSPGICAESNGGTLFLDEIGNTSSVVQSKLLRFIETKKYRVVGETHEKEVDVRLLYATNVNLEEKVKQNEFREDLYNRIKFLSIELEPLRSHPEDIIPIAESYLEGSEIQLSESAKNYLVNYSWPGNIRELKQKLDTARIFCLNNVIEAWNFTL